MGLKHESMKGMYSMVGKFYRPIAVKDLTTGDTNEWLHPSVVERYEKDPDYRPKNLADYFKRHPVSP
jgi:hypothetical protein